MNLNPFRRKRQLEWAEDLEMRSVEREAEEFYANILEEGDKPAFVSNEARVFDISSSTAEYLCERCSVYYRKSVTLNDLRLPFHLLLRKLNADRVGQGQDISTP